MEHCILLTTEIGAFNNGLQRQAGETRLLTIFFVRGIGQDGQGSLCTSDWMQYQMRKWRNVGKILAIGLNRPMRLYVVVVGGSFGTDDHQLNYSTPVTVDQLGNASVADTMSHRIMRRSIEAALGTLIAGDRGIGSRSDQLNKPTDLQFDLEGNLYVADATNNRVQKFLLDKSSF